MGKPRRVASAPGPAATPDGAAAGRAARTSSEWKSELRSRGLRATAPRVAVLQALSESGAPVTHGDLVVRLGPAGWDRATLYRNLIDLTEIGLVRRSDVGDHVWRFELLAEDHDHEHRTHFVCDACGDVVCLPDESLEIKSSAAAPKALQTRNVQIQIRGRCDDCV